MLVFKVLFLFWQIILSFTTNRVKVNDINNSKVLMNLTIAKLNLKQDIYEKGSSLNHIDKNVIILDESALPTKDKGIVLLGAHSGTGKFAYFKDLNKLMEGDIISVRYNNIEYRYKVINKYLNIKKEGISVNYNVNKKRLVLYTCNPNDKKHFLVVVSEIIL